MKTKRFGVGSKILAGMLAGLLSYAQIGGSGLVSIASAQQIGPPPSGAPTDDQKKEASTHYGAGKDKFKAGDYAGALVEFTAADNVIPTPNTAGYIGICQDKLGHNREALIAYQRFLKNPPASMSTEAAQATQRVATITYLLKSQASAPQSRGEAKYKLGDYAGALTEFQAADAIMQQPATSLYLGKCLDHLGKLADAVPPYQQYLATAPNGATDVSDVKTRVDQIMTMPGKVHVETTPPGASIAVDGNVQPSMATPADVSVPPGAHTIRFTLTGYDNKDVQVNVTYASTQSVPSQELSKNAPPPPPPPPPAPPPVAAKVTPPPPPPPAEPKSKVPAFVTGGLAVAAAGVGTVFGIMALGDKSDFDKNPTSSKADDGENHALIADMAFFVAVTLGVTSAVLFLAKDDAPATGAAPAKSNVATTKSKPFSITAAPIITQHGGGAGALIRF